jgi:hypothetical protein
VGTTFISQNVLRTTLLLSPLKANCLRFSTTVCDTQFMLIYFFCLLGLMFNLRGPQGQNPRSTCGQRTTVWETLPHAIRRWLVIRNETYHDIALYKRNPPREACAQFFFSLPIKCGNHCIYLFFLHWRLYQNTKNFLLYDNFVFIR